MCRTRYIHSTEHDVRPFMATLPFTRLGQGDYTAHSLVISHHKRNTKKPCPSDPYPGDSERFAEEHLDKLKWRQQPDGTTTDPHGRHHPEECEIQKFPLLDTQFGHRRGAKGLRSCPAHACCVCKVTMIFCNNFQRNSKCFIHPPENNPAAMLVPLPDDDFIWPDHGISMREMPSTPLFTNSHKRGRDVRGFVEQEYVWLGALAQAQSADEPHEGGGRWFDMNTPQVDVDYEKRFGSSVPFPLEAVYHRELTYQNYERWRDEHTDRPENRKPKEITLLNDARLQPGRGDKMSSVGMRYRADHESLTPLEHQPHIQVARYGHDLWCRKLELWHLITVEMFENLAVNPKQRPKPKPKPRRRGSLLSGLHGSGLRDSDEGDSGQRGSAQDLPHANDRTGVFYKDEEKRWVRNEEYIKRQVERMRRLLNQIIISWRSYLYWLRLSLLKIGQKVPENGESLMFKNGYVIEGHILRRFSFGEGEIARQEYDVYEAIDKEEIFTHDNETALAEICETWAAFADRDWNFLYNRWTDYIRRRNERPPHSIFRDMFSAPGHLKDSPIFWFVHSGDHTEQNKYREVVLHHYNRTFATDRISQKNRFGALRTELSNDRS